MAGAAVATVTGQLIAMMLGFVFNHAKNKELQLSPAYLRPHGRTIRTIYSVGLPSIIMQSISSVMTFGMNRILLLFSSTAVSVFGVYFKLLWRPPRPPRRASAVPDIRKSGSDLE